MGYLRFAARLGGLVPLLFAGLAFGQADTVSSYVEANKVIASAKIGPGWAPSSTSPLNGTTIGRSFMMPSPVGNVAARAVVHLGPAAAMAIGMRAISHPYLAVGMAAAPLAVAAWQYYRCRSAAYTAAYPVECDPGAEAQSSTQTLRFFTRAGVTGQWGSPSATCSAWAASANAANNLTAYVCHSVGGSGLAADGVTFVNTSMMVRDTRNNALFNDTALANNNPTTTANCGGQPQMYNALCATGNYEPTPDAVVVQKAISYPPNLTPEELRLLVDQSLGRIEPVNVSVLPAPSEMLANVMDTIPASGYLPDSAGNYPQPGDQVLVTNPDGSTRTDVLTWNITQVNDAIRDSATVRWGSKTTSTTRSPTGTVTGTTTTTSTPATIATPGGTPATGTSTATLDCAATPDILACAGLGLPPTDVVPTSTATLTYAEESLALPSACPVPLQPLPWLSVPYTAACDFATTIRSLVIAAGVFTAALMCTAAVRHA